MKKGTVIVIFVQLVVDDPVLGHTVKNYLHGLHGFVASSQKFVVSNRPRGNPKGVNFHGVSSKQFVPNFTVTVYFTTLSLE